MPSSKVGVVHPMRTGHKGSQNERAQSTFQNAWKRFAYVVTARLLIVPNSGKWDEDFFREFICTQSWVSLMLAQLFSPYLTNSGNPRYQWVSLSVVVWVLLTEKDINFLIVWVVLPLHPWRRDERGLCENMVKKKMCLQCGTNWKNK